MPNIKSAKKRVLVTAVKHERNKSIKTGLKNKIKKFETAVAASDVKTAQVEYDVVQSSLDSAARKGTIHKNKANRKKARMAIALNKASQA